MEIMNCDHDNRMLFGMLCVLNLGSATTNHEPDSCFRTCKASLNSTNTILWKGKQKFNFALYAKRIVLYRQDISSCSVLSQNGKMNRGKIQAPQNKKGLLMVK